jgi:chemotaxis signal transduction protein
VNSGNERAQGIDCGGLKVALPYSWARSVVDHFELTQVPNAPAWLAGAANVEGRVVPVIDLAVWAEPDTPAALATRSRLLIGGDGAEAFGLRFMGLPALLRHDAQSLRAPAVPAALQAFVQGAAASDSTDTEHRWPVLDIITLARQWANELA